MPVRMNRRWVIAKPFDGTVSEANFRWTEAPVPELSDGQFLVRNRWLSVDPTQVLALRPSDSATGPVGEPMWCLTVSEVLESRHPDFSLGNNVHGQMNWEDYTVTDGSGFNPAFQVPDDVPLRWAAGVLGLSGIVAYFGLHEVAQGSAGETILISGAAGGMGSILSQLAKLEGLRVIGIAGSPAKTAWLLEEAGIDAAIDYHREDVGKRLAELCPEGIDIYFDNHHGPLLEVALARLRNRGRVVLCGLSSQYAATHSTPGPSNLIRLIMVNGRMEGFLGRDFLPRRTEAFDALLPLLQSGRLKVKEDIAVGLREAPRALARLLAGKNVGKQLVRMDGEPAS